MQFIIMALHNISINKVIAELKTGTPVWVFWLLTANSTVQKKIFEDDIKKDKILSQKYYNTNEGLTLPYWEPTANC